MVIPKALVQQLNFLSASNTPGFLPTHLKPLGKKDMNQLLCITGFFPSIRFLDPSTLQEQFRIPCRPNHRVVQVSFPSDPCATVIATGEANPPKVSLFDVCERTQLMSLTGFSGQVWGLESLSLPSTTDPCIVASGEQDAPPCPLLVFNARTGEQIQSLPDPPTWILRIATVVEWERPEVFVGGRPKRPPSKGFVAGLHRYDVERGVKMGSYVGHRSLLDVNGIAAFASRNLVVSGSSGSTCKLWSRDDYSCERTIRAASYVQSVYAADDLNLLLVGNHWGGVGIWDVRQMDERVMSITTPKIPMKNPADIDRLDDTGTLFAVGSLTHMIVVDARTGRLVRQMRENRPNQIQGVRLLH